MSSIFVKAHKRGQSIVKAYLRSGQSMLKAQKQLSKISHAIQKKGQKKIGRYNTVVTAPANKAAREFDFGAAIAAARIAEKRVIGNKLLSRPLYSGSQGRRSRGQTMHALRADNANSNDYRRYMPRRVVAGPVSPYPKGTRIDYMAMVHPHSGRAVKKSWSGTRLERRMRRRRS